MEKSVSNQITSLMARTIAPLANKKNIYQQQLNEITPKDIKGIGTEALETGIDNKMLNTGVKQNQNIINNQTMPVNKQQSIMQPQNINKFGMTPETKRTGPSGVGAPRTGLSLGNF